jgi:hypothetical protein
VTSFRIAAIATMAVAVYAQKPHDVQGWDKVKWGMTVDQVRAAYGADAQPQLQDEWALLQLPPVMIAGVEMGVQVGARQASGKVSSVRLWSYFGSPNSKPMASARDFDALRTFLVQKYGTPANEDATRGENGRYVKTVAWKFPSTAIVLTLEQSASLPNLGKIFLEYTAAPR